MVWSLASVKRRRKLVEDAERSRASAARWAAAWALVVFYNMVGASDIVSTVIAIETGAGEEANPIMRALMEHIGDRWIIAKLALQAVISFMVLWFPHWIVLGFFLTATLGNAYVVYNNFVIAGVL